MRNGKRTWPRQQWNESSDESRRSNFQILDLYVLQQWPVRDVTRMLGVSAAQVYLARHRVGQLLKKELKRLQADSR